jgi:ArsR family transcriptional regulator
MKFKCCENKKAIADLSKTVEFLKVIGEENRLKILCLLKKGTRCVCEIWGYFDMSQNLVSHHLKVLTDFGLLLSEKDGLKVFYSLNKKNIKKYSKLLNNHLDLYEK